MVRTFWPHQVCSRRKISGSMAECRMMYQHDIASMREDARKAGLAEGLAEDLAEGRSEGAAQEKREIAK